MARGTPPPRRYRFGEFVLSPTRRSLRRRGREVPVIPRDLDLLLLLVERRSEALPRQEIFDRVWSDVVVSDGALSQGVRTLRRALGEDGEGGVFIRTVSRHGYQFVCPVTEESEVDGAFPANTEVEPHASSSAREPGAAREGAADAFASALARLTADASSDEERREAAEILRGLDATEARRRRGAGTARGWVFLRDSRWDVAGAGEVPLVGPAAGPGSWAALAGLRLRRAARLVGARWRRRPWEARSRGSSRGFSAES